jgi:hypothetical protein
MGFCSVVAHRERKGSLLVRTRAWADAESLRRYLGCSTPLIRTPDADYPFRFVVTRKNFARAMLQFAFDDLDYGNFKGRVFESDPERERVYAEVWALLRKRLDPRLRAASLEA